MIDGVPSADLNPPHPRVDFSFNDGLGLTRTTGEIIALLLTAEEVHNRASILAYVARGLNISIDEIVTEYREYP